MGAPAIEVFSSSIKVLIQEFESLLFTISVLYSHPLVHLMVY